MRLLSGFFETHSLVVLFQKPATILGGTELPEGATPGHSGQQSQLNQVFEALQLMCQACA